MAFDVRSLYSSKTLNRSTLISRHRIFIRFVLSELSIIFSIKTAAAFNQFVSLSKQWTLSDRLTTLKLNHLSFLAGNWSCCQSDCNLNMVSTTSTFEMRLKLWLLLDLYTNASTKTILSGEFPESNKSVSLINDS